MCPPSGPFNFGVPEKEPEWYGFRLMFGNRDETAVTEKIGEYEAKPPMG